MSRIACSVYGIKCAGTSADCTDCAGVSRTDTARQAAQHEKLINAKVRAALLPEMVALWQEHGSKGTCAACGAADYVKLAKSDKRTYCADCALTMSMATACKELVAGKGIA